MVSAELGHEVSERITSLLIYSSFSDVYTIILFLRQYYSLFAIGELTKIKPRQLQSIILHSADPNQAADLGSVANATKQSFKLFSQKYEPGRS